MPAIRSVPDANVRSKSFYVARTSARCRHCGKSTRLLALAMPHDHETLEANSLEANSLDDAPPSSDEWQQAHANALLFYVAQLPDEVQGQLHRLSRFFRLSHSAATLNSYWANHCEHCDTLLDDHELHCEPDGAFMPASEIDAANIELLQIPQPLQAATSGYALEPEFFRFMRRI
jgi:hypothetical protein